MKNIGGGYIVIGVKDKTWEPIGLSSPIPYDSKMLRDQVIRASGLDIEILTVSHDINVGGSIKHIAVVFTRGSTKRSKRRMPSIVIKDYCHKERHGLRKGDIYFRKGDSTVKVKGSEELEALLELYEEQTDESLLTTGQDQSPFAIEEGTYRLLEKGYESFIGRDVLKSTVRDAVTKDPRMWIINVHGPGGVGKSALVNYVVYEFYEKRVFEAIIHLSGKATVLTEVGIHKQEMRSLYSLDNLLDQVLSTFGETTNLELDGKKQIALEYLAAYKTLLVLDNMETVSDGRILEFIRSFPVGSPSKALLTNRRRTGGWEQAVNVDEMDRDEVREFMAVRSRELQIALPHDPAIVAQVWQASGGLPLAIQWILAQFRRSPNLDLALEKVSRKDSPVLEFSFRNVWTMISGEARAALVAMTIFDNPPTIQEICIATEWPFETAEKSLDELIEATLVTRTTQMSDGKVTYSSLPITLEFAKHRASDMGDFELKCAQRVQRYSNQMALIDSEVTRFKSTFERYGLGTENEKRAAILCRRGESEMFAGNVDNAELLFKQAREKAPQCSYVYAMSASYELNRGRVGLASDFAEKACDLAGKKTGALANNILARICHAKHDGFRAISALRKAVEFEPEDPFFRHKLGVALSKASREKEAIEEFTKIIDAELKLPTPREQLLIALKTRIINYRRLGMQSQAQSDLELAKGILTNNPHLAYEADQFAELAIEEPKSY